MGARAPRGAESSVVFDTNILISHLRGLPAGRELLASVPYTERLISAVVAMELYRGAMDRADHRQIKKFIDDRFPGVVQISSEMSRRAMTLVERFALSHRLNPIDALIAATALTLNATLATSNGRHFSFIPSLRLRTAPS